MKNRFIFNCLLFVAICFFSISMNNIIVKAVDEFPEKIYVGSSSLIKYDGGGNIFKKSYTTADGSYAGKAYCSSFWASAPGENSDTRIECTKEGWPNNQYAAAIGAIVNAARSSDGSTTWYNYYYAELAINRFLYLNITPKNDIYNYAPYTIINSSKFNGYLNKAKATYDEYNSQSILEINVGNPKFSNNKITSNISCKVGSERVECPKDMAVTIKIGNKDYNVSKTNGNDESLTVSADVTNLNAGTYTATVSASYTKNLLDIIQVDMYNRALERRNKLTFTATNMQEINDILNKQPGFIQADWCGNLECEEKIKEIKGCKSRCITDSKLLTGKCVCCGCDAKHSVIWGIQY